MTSEVSVREVIGGGYGEFWRSRQRYVVCKGSRASKKSTTLKNSCFAWLEEAYQCTEEDFERVDESLRGKLPEGYYIQWLITFNPWSSSSWLKARFFDTPDENVLAMTTTYRCNEFLSAADRELYENVRLTNPERAKVVCDGDWGIESGQYFSEWRENLHVVKPFAIPREWLKFRAMDFGQARPYAVLWFAVDFDGNIFAYRELYGWGGKPNVGTGETARQIGERIAQLETPDEKLSYGVLDSACWARTGVTGPTIQEELNDVLIGKRLVAFEQSSKGRLEGANAFKQRLVMRACRGRGRRLKKLLRRRATPVAESARSRFGRCRRR